MIVDVNLTDVVAVHFLPMWTGKYYALIEQTNHYFRSSQTLLCQEIVQKFQIKTFPLTFSFATFMLQLVRTDAMLLKQFMDESVRKTF